MSTSEVASGELLFADFGTAGRFQNLVEEDDLGYRGQRGHYELVAFE